MPRRSASISINDVAKHAGVSKKTVSRVINNQAEISDETRQRVLQSIAELNYRPNRLARSLSSGKSHTIGIIIPNISDPFFPALVLGAEAVAREQDYNVFLCNTSGDAQLELKYIDLLSQSQVDGVMIVGSRLNEEGLKYVVQNHRAVILTPYQVQGAALITLDEAGSTYQACKYLLALGHRCLRFVNSTWARSPNQRFGGFARAMQEAGLSVDNVLFGPVMIGTNLDQNIENACQVTLQMLVQDPSITGVVCYNDVVALGVLQACLKLGRKVPEGFSVIGFDNIPEASRSFPPLTTMGVNRFELGKTMMSTLFKVIKNPDIPIERMVFGLQMVERASCAVPKTSSVKP